MFNLTRNPGYYGHFSCPSGEEEGASYSMVSTKLFYESYHLSEVKWLSDIESGLLIYDHDQGGGPGGIFSWCHS